MRFKAARKKPALVWACFKTCFVLSFAAWFVVPCASAQIAGLVAAYSFDEGTGEVARDASGNGNHGALGSAGWTASGRYGTALFFDGSGALVTVPDSPSLHLAGGMTLEAWVNPVEVDYSWRDVIYKGQDDYYLEATSALTSASAAGGTFGGKGALTAGTEPLPSNAWSHLAATYDGATIRLYVDGVLVSSQAQRGTIATSGTPLQIGGDGIFGQYFAGLIDEVRIYNFALTEAQILKDMNTAISDTSPPSVISLECSPSTIPAGGTSACTVAISRPAPAEGASVSLTVDSAALTTPASAFVPAGSVSAAFNVAAGSVTANQTAVISATLNGGVTSSTFTIQAPAPGATGLVAAYSFSEGAGNRVTDVSGNGNTGMIANAAWTNLGKYGNALVFNGTSSWISINDSPALHLTTGMTLEAWVQPLNVSNAWSDVIYKGDDAYYLEATSMNGALAAGGGTFDGATRETYGTNALPPNTWTHLALTYDGAALRLFVNGALVSSRVQTGNILVSQAPLQIGGDSTYGQYFAGVIDEIRIYNVALSDAEIVVDMNTPVAGAGSGPAAVLSSSTINFPNQLLGATSTPRTLTLTNVGGGSMALGSITVSGPDASDFQQTANCGSFLPAGAGCTVTIVYTPTHTGDAVATLVITDDAPGAPQTVALSGTGVSSLPLSVSPAAAAIAVNGTVQFSAPGSSGALIWLVDGIAGGSAASGTITNSGLYLAPGLAGVHSVTVSTADLTQSASATVAVTTVNGTPGFLQLSSNRRYLVDQNNTPFLIQGDSPQALIGNLSEAEASLYFANRQAHGFNTVWINLLCRSFTRCNSDASTFDGIPPFLNEDDLSTPNEQYFQRADRMIELAAQFGIVVLLDPIEVGGWLDILRSNGPEKAFNYGVYVGNRYRNTPNIIWLNGNDFQTWTDPEDDALTQSVARGIQAADPNHLQTVELNFLASTSLDDNTWAPLISLNAAYTYFPTYAEVLHGYNQADPPIPVFMIEANYEFEHQVNDEATAAILRRQEYWTAFSGAAGQFYASFYSYSLSPGWQNFLDSPGTVQLGYLKNLLSGREWYNLIPDQNHTIVTGGYGTFTDTGALSASDYLTAASTADGSLMMAYMPTLRAITVDMTKFKGPVYAQWYDPANGSYLPIAGAPFSNSESMQFLPPGNNSDGDGDWVLVLETDSKLK